MIPRGKSWTANVTPGVIEDARCRGINRREAANIAETRKSELFRGGPKPIRAGIEVDDKGRSS